MSVEAGVVALLKADETVAALVAARIYPIYIPETGSLPCVVYQVTGKEDIYSSGGMSTLVNSKMQLTCFASTYLGVVALCDAVRDAMGAYSGTVGGCVIRVVFLTDQGDIPEIEPDSDVLRRFARRMNFDIWNEE